jgi:transcription termination factor NusB
MRKILDIFEQDEDEVELTDYEKILALNKKKIHPNEVEFYNSEGEDFSDIIEVTRDGIIFTFDGLDEFLRFFFPDVFGDEGTDGWYEAGYLDSMYRGTWEYDFWDRSSDDWDEGYVIDSVRGESAKVLYEILEKTSPLLAKKLKVNIDGNIRFTDSLNHEITDFIDILSERAKDDLISAYVYANEAATASEVPNYIESYYCDGLKDVGIERYSNKHCFWKYELSWGPAIMLFVRHGSSDDNLLDLMFEAIRKEFKRHTPEYYEIQHEAWDGEIFNNYFGKKSLEIFENLLSEIQEDETKIDGNFKKYLKIIDIISQKIGFNKWKKLPTPDDTGASVFVTNRVPDAYRYPYEIMIEDVDKETLKVNYKIKNTKTWTIKMGSAPIESIFNMLNMPELFDPMEYRS